MISLNLFFANMIIVFLIMLEKRNIKLVKSKINEI